MRNVTRAGSRTRRRSFVYAASLRQSSSGPNVRCSAAGCTKNSYGVLALAVLLGHRLGRGQRHELVGAGVDERRRDVAVVADEVDHVADGARGDRDGALGRRAVRVVAGEADPARRGRRSGRGTAPPCGTRCSRPASSRRRRSGRGRPRVLEHVVVDVEQVALGDVGAVAVGPARLGHDEHAVEVLAERLLHAGLVDEARQARVRAVVGELDAVRARLLRDVDAVRLVAAAQVEVLAERARAAARAAALDAVVAVGVRDALARRDGVVRHVDALVQAGPDVATRVTLLRRSATSTAWPNALTSPSRSARDWRSSNHVPTSRGVYALTLKSPAACSSGPRNATFMTGPSLRAVTACSRQRLPGGSGMLPAITLRAGSPRSNVCTCSQPLLETPSVFHAPPPVAWLSSVSIASARTVWSGL